ncbi:MAG TPA: ABC transporter permease [Ilumatobacteraceae bacterium]|nr:ABC transporter permease [Ilumatobacteraceae bacterium]
MQDFLAYTVLGICLGSVYAIAAAGIVVTYTTSGMFNFAHGAVATMCALVYWQLNQAWHVPGLIAAVLTVCCFAPALGIFLELVVMRGLRDTNEVTKLVVPIAVLLAITGTATWIWFRDGARAIVPKRFFGAQSIDVLGQPVYYHQVIGVVLAAAIAVGLYLVMYRTRLGVTMRATVDDRRLLMLNGGRPDHASMASWGIGCGLAGLAGVLLASQQGALQVFALTLLVIDSYAAAVAGRLRSVPIAYVGAMVLGLARSYFDMVSNAGQNWPAIANMRNAIPAILLFAALLLLPQGRLRGAVVTRTRERFNVPTMKQAVAWGAILIVGVAMLQALMKGAAVINLTNSMALSLMALSLVLLTGYAGEINLAVYAFAGIALIAAWQFDVGPGGLATQESLSLAAIVLAMVICAFIGGLIALPALRLSGLYLGLATFAFGVIVYQLVILQPRPLQGSIFGQQFTVNFFTNGSVTVPRPRWFGVDFRNERAFLILLTVMFVVIGIMLIRLRRSAYGRMIIAMKDSPAACATLGMNITRLKLGVFMLSAAIAGLGGLMWAAQQRTVASNNNFDGFASLLLFMIAVVCGIGYVSGALLAGVFLSVLSLAIPNVFEKLGSDYESLHWLFVTGLGNFAKFIGAALIGIRLARNPSGIAQQVMDGFRPLRRVPVGTGVWVASIMMWWLLAWRGVIGNWTFALGVIASAFIVPRLLMAMYPQRFIDEGNDGQEDLDMIGLSRPFVTSDRDRFDRELAIPVARGGRSDVTA